MNLHKRKIAFVTEFFRLQDENLISRFEDMLKKRTTEIYQNSLEPMSLDQFYDEIKQSLDDSKNDRVIKANKLKSKYA